MVIGVEIPLPALAISLVIGGDTSETPRDTVAVICDTFIHLAIDTWFKLQQGYPLGLTFGEESITDHNLYELGRRHPSEVTIQKFTKTREHAIGADWAFILGNSTSGYAHIRIQAKKVDHRGNFRKVLGHGPRPRQADKLIDSALRDSAYPLFAFYSWWTGSHSPTSNQCCLTSQLQPMPPWLFGVSVASAPAVRQTLDGGGRQNLQTLIPLSRPWSCLVCCERDPSASLAGRTIATVESIHREYLEQSGGDIPGDFASFEPQSIWTQALPAFVNQALEGRLESQTALPQGFVLIRDD